MSILRTQPSQTTTLVEGGLIVLNVRDIRLAVDSFTWEFLYVPDLILN